MENNEKDALPIKVIPDNEADAIKDERMTNAQASVVHTLAAKTGEQIEGEVTQQVAAEKIDELIKEKGLDGLKPPHQNTEGEVHS